MKDHRCLGYCEQTALQIVRTVRERANGNFLSATAQQLRRRRDNALLREIFEELDRAFITPMDREDLWKLCTDMAAILRAAQREETATIKEIILSEAVLVTAQELRRDRNRAVTAAQELCEQAWEIVSKEQAPGPQRFGAVCAQWGETALTALLKMG